MKFHKRQLVLASLAVALGAAVYLNWHFSDDKGLKATGILETTRELGEARYVNTSHVENEENKNTVTDNSMTDEMKKYFAQARSNKQKAHEEAEEKLKNIVSGTDVNADIKDEVLKQIENLGKNIEQETNIENLIKAKGFGDAVVCIQNGECSVVVSPGGLDESTAVVIRDIITGQSAVQASNIKITEAK